MERTVVLIVGEDEYDLGTVAELLSEQDQPSVVQAIRGLVEDMVFEDDSSDYTVCTLEVR